MTPFSFSRAALVGAVLGGALFQAAALDITPTTDAFDLGNAFAAPGNGLSAVTGDFTESASPASAERQLGLFQNGASLLGIDSGIVLSTGSVAALGIGAPTASFDFGSAPSGDTASLLGRIPGQGDAFADPVRLSLTVTPEFASDFLNFSIAFGTSEAGLSTDRLGIFVNDDFYGLVAGQPLDQNHPWMAIPATSIGLDRMVHPDGDPLGFPSVTVSIPIQQPGSPLRLDFVLADTTDGGIDSALFLGNLTGSAVAQGVVIPEPGTAAALPLLIGGAAFAWWRRRRTA
jgi:hypothetical protein